MERFYSMNWSAWTTWLQEFQHQFNLGSPGGLQAMETVSEPLCSREGTSIIQIKKCWSTDEEILGKFPLDCNSYQLNLFSKLITYPFFIVVQVQSSPFSPHPTHPCLPPLILHPFGFIHVSFIHVPWWPFPFFPIIPSGYCQFVLYFSVSGYILFAWLFCWLGEKTVGYVPSNTTCLSISSQGDLYGEKRPSK